MSLPCASLWDLRPSPPVHLARRPALTPEPPGSCSHSPRRQSCLVSPFVHRSTCTPGHITAPRCLLTLGELQSKAAAAPGAAHQPSLPIPQLDFPQPPGLLPGLLQPGYILSTGQKPTLGARLLSFPELRFTFPSEVPSLGTGSL